MVLQDKLTFGYPNLRYLFKEFEPDVTLCREKLYASLAVNNYSQVPPFMPKFLATPTLIQDF